MGGGGGGVVKVANSLSTVDLVGSISMKSSFESLDVSTHMVQRVYHMMPSCPLPLATHGFFAREATRMSLAAALWNKHTLQVTQF